MFEKFLSGKTLFFIVAMAAIIAFLVVSNNLVKELAAQEKERMDIWAKATERLAQADMESDFDFLLSIIEQNNTIPVLVADSGLNIRQFRNFKLPDREDLGKFSFDELSQRNRDFLTGRLKKATGDLTMREASKTNPHFIEVSIENDTYQYIYYEDSILLKRLSLYPYVQLVVMLILIGIIYGAIVYTNRAEQNRVWVGLSKETAHQLGTPISSLMAWTQYLESVGTEKEIVDELNKDVNRLSIIADRFSKIGSRPELRLEYINDTLSHALDYMRSRISGRVNINMNLPADDHAVMISPPLFAWVMENLTKNAVDAMDGQGNITITSGVEKNMVYIEITDTGKGIHRKNFKKVFSPGFTTKKRGWGLGLTLAKRIITDYHNGDIFVKDSELGKGTTFRIELPLTQ